MNSKITKNQRDRFNDHVNGIGEKGGVGTHGLIEFHKKWGNPLEKNGYRLDELILNANDWYRQDSLIANPILKGGWVSFYGYSNPLKMTFEERRLKTKYPLKVL